MHAGPNAQWNDMPCDSAQHVVVEFNPRRLLRSGTAMFELLPGSMT